MTLLTTQEKTQVLYGAMRYWSNEFQATNLSKQDIIDAIADTDQWIENHSGNTSADTVGYNGALSTNFKTNATATQKTFLFCLVAARRVSKAFAEKLVGVID